MSRASAMLGLPFFSLVGRLGCGRSFFRVPGFDSSGVGSRSSTVNLTCLSNPLVIPSASNWISSGLVGSSVAKISPSGMETMAVVARSKCCSRSESQLCRDFRGFSFRIFESSARILPSPCSPVCHCYSQYEQKSPSFHSEQEGKQRTKRKTISLTTPPKVATFDESVSLSERWAGPAYSNSPPPSSLPIPKFSLRQKRSISLELKSPKVTGTLPALSKSAPSSPTNDSPLSAGNLFFNTVIATENLRRILQLDIEDH